MGWIENLLTKIDRRTIPITYHPHFIMRWSTQASPSAMERTGETSVSPCDSSVTPAHEICLYAMWK